MNDDNAVKIMEEIEANRNYFNAFVAKNPNYFGKVVIVDKKNVVGIFENNKASEVLRKIGKTAYYAYVPKDEGESFNT